MNSGIEEKEDIMDKKIKVFCIHHAGGMSYAYKEFRKKNDFFIQYIPLDLSGHGRSMNKPLFTKIEEMVDDVYEKLVPLIEGGEYVLLGHSMGGWVAYELVKKIQKSGLHSPCMLVISANVPPALYRDNVDINSGDEEIRRALIAQGGAMKEALENDAINEVFFPIIKADYQAINNYAASKVAEETVNCNVLTFVGRDDCINKEYVKEWRNFTKFDFRFIELEGDHFAIYQNVDRVDQIIRSEVELLVRKEGYEFIQ